MVGELSAWRPVTPTRDYNHSTSSLNLEDQPSPLPIVPTGSPHNSFGGTLDSRSPSLSRQQSKTSIRSFFSRGRSTSHASQRPDSASSRSRPATRSSKTSGGSIARPESPHLSRMGSKLDSYRPTQATHAAHIDRARAERRQRRPSACWDPPPLFQAYAQALKHATLDASCLSTDVILRRGSSTTTNAADELVKDDTKEALITNLSLNGFIDPPKKQTHARKLSTVITMSGWTKHLYVLVTSGHLLQYAGEGHHDRLPEKILQLGKDTVAFASDAIPGKHWVLQISQMASEGAIVLPESSKGLWSRIGGQSSESRRTAQNFLMVFDGADDLDSWLNTIRREVESLGGRQYRPQTPSDFESDHGTFSQRSSQRFTWEKDPYQFPRTSSILNPQVLSPVESEFPPDEVRHKDDRMLDFRFWDTESLAEKATEDSSTVTSTELDRLRDSKDSTGTTDTGTSASFRSHSSMSSPVCDKFNSTALPSFEPRGASAILDAQFSNAQKRESFVFDSFSSTFLLDALETDDWDNVHAGPRIGPTAVKRRSTVAAPNYSIPTAKNTYSVFALSSELKPSSISDNSAANATSSHNEQPRIFLDLSIPSPPNAEFPEEALTSSRPISTIAPLPTPFVLKNPTGSRQRVARRPSLEITVVQPNGPSNHTSHDPDQNHIAGPAMIPKRLSSLEQTKPALPAPLPPPKRDLPPLPVMPAKPKMPKSKSHQELPAFLKQSATPEPIAFLDISSRDNKAHRVSLSVFPEPPSNLRQRAASPNGRNVLESSQQSKSVLEAVAATALRGLPEPPSNVQQRVASTKDDVPSPTPQSKPILPSVNITALHSFPEPPSKAEQPARKRKDSGARPKNVQQPRLTLPSNDITAVVLGFPEPPLNALPSLPDFKNGKAQNLPQQLKPLISTPGITALPQIPSSGPTPETGVNARLSKIRAERGLPKLGLPPQGPPPSCPLPDTPSPRKRHFGKLPKQTSSPEGGRSTRILPFRRTSMREASEK